MITKFWYRLGSTDTINLASTPFKRMTISSSVSVWSYSTCRYIVETSRPLWSLIADVIIIPSNVNVGDAESSFLIFLRCFLPPANCFALIFPSRFSVSKINDKSTPDFSYFSVCFHRLAWTYDSRDVVWALLTPLFFHVFQISSSLFPNSFFVSGLSPVCVLSPCHM